MSTTVALYNGAPEFYVGLPSTGFIVQLFGDPLDADQTFVPFASGFSASFSPASLTIPAGVNFGFFTATASTAGSGQVGVTSSGLTVPPLAAISHDTFEFLPAAGFASTASIAFLSDGTLMGSFPVGSIADESGSLSVADGLATFNFAPRAQYPRSYSYGSGSLSVVGTLPGKSEPETLLTMSCLPCCLDDADSGWIFASPVMGVPSVAADITGTFGAVGEFAFFTMKFTGSPGSSGCVLTSAKIVVMN